MSGTACGGSQSSADSPSTAADSFDQDRARIKDTVPGWDEGTGATVRFLKEASGERLSLIFVDPTAPEWNEKQSLWLVVATAKADGEPLGHLVFGLPKLEAGSYEGGPGSKNVVMAILLGERKWDGTNPEATWSINDGSWCKLVLRDAGGGNLEGDFQGKLVDNKGTGYLTIESGYVMINKR
jgi:hypothetical protein